VLVAIQQAAAEVGRGRQFTTTFGEIFAQLAFLFGRGLAGVEGVEVFSELFGIHSDYIFF